MKSTENTPTRTIRGTIIAAALAVAVAVPVAVTTANTQQALATTGDQGAPAAAMTTTTESGLDNLFGTDDFEGTSNEEYVEGLVGLTDAEKQELLALYDKWDALAADEDLSDADYNRLCELEDKAYYAEIEASIDADTSITEAERTAYKQQLSQLQELEAYFNDYYSNPTYLENLDKYETISDSLGDYLGWCSSGNCGNYADCADCEDCFDCTDCDNGTATSGLTAGSLDRA